MSLPILGYRLEIWYDYREHVNHLCILRAFDFFNSLYEFLIKMFLFMFLEIKN